jgi:hypothetical protein
MSNKETVEGAANNWVKSTSEFLSVKNGFKAGAKWQAERMYSEEELKSAFKIGFNIGYGSPVSELDLKQQHCDKWFSQFKKQNNEQ